MKSRKELGNFLNELGLTGKGVEIGVCRGKFSEVLLDTWEGDKLYLIDPWKSFEKHEYQELGNLSQKKQDRNFKETCKRLSRFDSKRYEFIRETSEEALNKFEDGSLDFVYVDGNHDYPYVLKDIYGYYKKVKSGGVLCGHDYYNSYILNICGVKRAVKEFCSEYGYPVCITTRDLIPSWYIIKD